MEPTTQLFILLFLFGIYFLPTFVGWGKRNGTAIFMLNLFLGWTALGWVGALIWACIPDNK